MTTIMNYNRGSEWRRWDLHVHAPSEYTCAKRDNFEGLNLSSKQDIFISQLREVKEVAVIGITDYFSLEGYKCVMSKAPLNNFKLILPNIELRITPVTSKGSKINLHIIPNTKVLSVDEIERFLYKFEFGKDKLTCCHDDLIKLGKTLEYGLSDEKAFVKGLNEFAISYNTFFDKFNEQPQFFKDNTLICVSNSNHDGVSGIKDLTGIRSIIYEGVNIIFSSNPSDQKYFIGEGCDSKEVIIQKYGGLKPCIHGCDYHGSKNGEEICVPDQKRFCWINADPTFEGFKQILNEPSRVFIGKKPPLVERIEKNPSKYINNLTINKIHSSNIDEIWYGESTSIDINPGLVSIIGNKGSGKSAIADIIGLCSNSQTNRKEWSFLTPKKFCSNTPYDRSKKFEARIRWYDDTESETITLDAEPKIEMPERVKYIPQNFLENICTTEDEKEFEKEIKNISIQHLPLEKRYGKNDFDEIVNYLSKSITDQIVTIKQHIKIENEKIIKLEEKAECAYKNKLQHNLDLKKQELCNLEKRKPAEVQKPNHTPNDEDYSKREAIEKVRNQIEIISDKIIKIKNASADVTKQIQDLNTFKTNIGIFTASFDKLRKDNENLCNVCGLNFDSVLKIAYDENIVLQKIQSLENIKNEYTLMLSSEGEKSLFMQKDKLSEQLLKLEDDLNKEDKQYQKYLSDLKQWEEEYTLIKGSETIDDTILYYERQLKYIDEELENEINAVKSNRKQLVISLIEEKRKYLNIYQEMYQPISDFIETNNQFLTDYPVNIQAEFTFDNITNFLSSFIDRGKSGTYSGAENATKQLNAIVGDTDLSDSESVYEFAFKLNDSLTKDYKDNTSKQIESQLKQGKTRQELYDYIYCIEYIKPILKLKLANKELPTLSPGERGALLLLFYLFIDKEDKPLVIDQPEENLDNESVYKYLVNFIKKAKQHRQIIMITHNPNLAVVCDSDQIIRMDIDKKNKNIVSFISGAIENPEINKAVLKILEGTYPAFHNRDSKYFCKDFS